jgi:acyl-CoA synthetase (AMP-forming)/AMP-acid ligase II
VFAGYFRDPEATRAVIDDEGWLHTGDVVEQDEAGHLRIVDRKKAIIITAGGKNISPSEVENALKVSPYIKEAIVLGEGEKYIAALVQIDYDNVGKWAIDQKIAYTNFKSLSQQASVLELISGEVETANAVLQAMGNHPEIPKFQMWTEVIQDAVITLMADGSLNIGDPSNLLYIYGHDCNGNPVNVLAPSNSPHLLLRSVPMIKEQVRRPIGFLGNMDVVVAEVAIEE